MLHPFRKFVRISKVSEQKDGTLLVSGMVTAEIPDQENEVCDYETTKPFYRALAAHYAKTTGAVDGMEQSLFPVREMHQLIAAGCGKAIDFDDAAKTIDVQVHVVDASSCKKVKAGVLLGFSHGGDYVKTWKKNGHTYYTADVSEVSLVDSPCLKEAVIESLVEKSFTYEKTDGSTSLVKFAVEKKPPKVDLKSPEARKAFVAKAKADGFTADRIKKAHEYSMGKGMYTVSATADCLQTLAYVAASCANETAYENDGSEVPEQLKQVLTQLVDAFCAMAEEESRELLAQATSAGAKAMKPELLKKLREIGKTAVTFTPEEMDDLRKLADAYDALEKAGKTAVDHLQSLHKMHDDHHASMVKAHDGHMADCQGAIAKCAKVLGVSETGQGAVTGGGEKANTEKTLTKADADKLVADALEKAKKDAETATAAAATAAAAGTGAAAATTAADAKFSKADVAQMIEEALVDAAKAANDPTKKAKLTLVPRPGEVIKTAEAAATTAVAETPLAKSAGI